MKKIYGERIYLDICDLKEMFNVWFTQKQIVEESLQILHLWEFMLLKNSATRRQKSLRNWRRCCRLLSYFD